MRVMSGGAARRFARGRRSFAPRARSRAYKTHRALVGWAKPAVRSTAACPPHRAARASRDNVVRIQFLGGAAAFAGSAGPNSRPYPDSTGGATRCQGL